MPRKKDDDHLPHVVYRCWGEDRLLYVGVTKHLDKRISQHKYATRWWDEVTRIDSEEFPNRHEACEGETHAILFQFPLYNRNFW